MAILYFSKLSPYAAKARMAVVHTGYPASFEAVDTLDPPAAFIEANPLGKVPVLVTDEGHSLHDSRIILRFLDQWSGGRLYPDRAEAMQATARIESLCDGICDCLQAYMAEIRYRPEEKRHQPWLDKQWQKVVRGLASLEGRIADHGDEIHGGTLALRGMLGYLGIRFEGRWESDNPRLVAWMREFDRRNPALVEVAPRM